MIPRGVAKRYATALFNAALKANIADDVHAEASTFRKLFSENPSFKNFLLSPQILTKAKKDFITATLKGRASDLFVTFLLLLIDKKRFPFVEDIAEGYSYLYERHKGILEVKAITAVPLDESMTRKTITKLEQESGKRIRLVPIVDPKIIGGMILIMEDKIIDGSIRFRIERLKRELDEIRV
jgi:F-type H+-transporting ATPase subunit delta